MNRLHRPALLLSSLACLLSLAGCPGGGGGAGGAAGLGADEVLARVLQQERDGKTDEALQTGETWLKAHADSKGDLHRALARMYGELGDVAAASRHLGTPGASGASAPKP